MPNDFDNVQLRGGLQNSVVRQSDGKRIILTPRSNFQTFKKPKAGAGIPSTVTDYETQTVTTGESTVTVTITSPPDTITVTITVLTETVVTDFVTSTVTVTVTTEAGP